jgi:hypothetical protein
MIPPGRGRGRRGARAPRAGPAGLTRLVVVSAVIETPGSLDLRFPPIDAARRRELDATRAAPSGESRWEARAAGRPAGPQAREP